MNSPRTNESPQVSSPSALKRFFTSIRTRVAHNRIAQMLVATAVGWHHDRVSRLASSLSFYALLSLVPLLVTFHALFSLVFDAQTLSTGVDTQISSFIGVAQAQAVREMLNHARSPSLASLQAIIGSLVTFVTAAGVFIELKDSMDAIWKAPKSERSGILVWLSAYFAPLSMVLGFAFLLLITLLLDALLNSMATALTNWNPALLAILVSGNLLVGWLVAAVLFASLFRWLPTATVAWRDVWLGAAITATLFIVGRILIGMYIGRSDFTGQYGPAGAVVAIIVWIYYSAQILFTGAVFTREHARLAQRHQKPALPSSPQPSPASWLDDDSTVRAP